MLQLHAIGEPTHNQCLGQFIGHNRIEEEQLVYTLHSLPDEDGIQQFARRYLVARLLQARCGPAL